MTAAGFKIAEQQGRDIQNSPTAKVQFADWVKEKQNMLSNTKTKTASQNNNQADAVM